MASYEIRRSKVLEKLRHGKIACSIKTNVTGQDDCGVEIHCS